MERSVEPFRELEAEISMAFAQVVGPLDPWQASYHIGAELHGVVHQRRRLGVRVKALLRKRADLKLHEPSEAALGLERSLQLGQPGETVHVDEHPTCNHTVSEPERQGLADAPCHILDRVRLLPCPLLDDRDDVLVAELVVGHRRAIATLVTFRQPRWIPFGLAVVVAMCLSAVKGLTDMEMGVDEARHNKPASGVDDLG